MDVFAIISMIMSITILSIIIVLGIFIFLKKRRQNLMSFSEFRYVDKEIKKEYDNFLNENRASIASLVNKHKKNIKNSMLNNKNNLIDNISGALLALISFKGKPTTSQDVMNLLEINGEKIVDKLRTHTLFAQIQTIFTTEDNLISNYQVHANYLQNIKANNNYYKKAIYDIVENIRDPDVKSHILTKLININEHDDQAKFLTEFTFYIFDKNKDGYISSDDLFIDKYKKQNKTHKSPIPHKYEGKSVKCKNDENTEKAGYYYRISDSKLRHYPNQDIAATWDKELDKAFIIDDCSDIPIGKQMKRKDFVDQKIS